MINMHITIFSQIVILEEEVIFLDQQPTYSNVPSNYVKEFFYLNDPQVAPRLLQVVPISPQIIPPITFIALPPP
jgi:hypothetical protein